MMVQDGSNQCKHCLSPWFSEHKPQSYFVSYVEEIAFKPGPIQEVDLKIQPLIPYSYHFSITRGPGGHEWNIYPGGETLKLQKKFFPFFSGA